MEDYYVVYRDSRGVKVSWVFYDKDYFGRFIGSVQKDGATVIEHGSIDDQFFNAVRPLLEKIAGEANANGKNVDVDALRQNVAAILASHEQSFQTLP